MKQIKATLRIDQSHLNHNDRSSASSDKNVIHPELTKENRVFLTNGKRIEQVSNGNFTLYGKVKEMYKILFSTSLARKNEHYKNKGNTAAIKTFDQFFKTAKPKEMVLQIGKTEDYENGLNLDEDELLEATIELNQRIITKYPTVIPVAISEHIDEQVRHVHDNFIFVHKTEYGDYENNQKQALLDCGVKAEPWDEEKWLEEEKKQYPDHFTEDGDLTNVGKKRKKSAKNTWERDHNELIVFTDDIREMWYEILDKRLEKYGYEIDKETDPNNRSRRNKQTQQWKQEQLAAQVSDLTETLTDLQQKSSEKETQIKRQEKVIQTQSAQIEDQAQWIQAQEAQIKSKDVQLQEKDALIQEKNDEISRLNKFFIDTIGGLMFRFQKVFIAISRLCQHFLDIGAPEKEKVIEQQMYPHVKKEADTRQRISERLSELEAEDRLGCADKDQVLQRVIDEYSDLTEALEAIEAEYGEEEDLEL